MIIIHKLFLMFPSLSMVISLHILFNHLNLIHSSLLHHALTRALIRHVASWPAISMLRVTALNISLLVFLILRPLKDVGYSLKLRLHDIVRVVGCIVFDSHWRWDGVSLRTWSLGLRLAIEWDPTLLRSWHYHCSSSSLYPLDLHMANLRMLTWSLEMDWVISSSYSFWWLYLKSFSFVE